MGSPSCDKRYPVSYTKSLKVVGTERQKPVTMVEFAGPGFIYKPAPAYPYPSNTSSHPNTLRNMAIQKTIPSSSDDTRNMMVPTQANIKGQVVWPSPPLAPCDVDVHYCIQDSVAPSNGMAPEYNYTPVSPNGWCPSVPSMHEAPARYHGQGPTTSNVQGPSNTCTTSSSVDLGLDSSDGFLLALSCENGDPNNHMWGVDLLPPMETFETSPASQSESVVESPASMDTPRDTPSSQNLESRSVPSSASPPSHSTESGETEKSDEPYAKLIYKAFMSRPDYSMTLQEIYQWFRANTRKALTETGGWQNSIRHNLSMNAVSCNRSLLSRIYTEQNESGLMLMISLFISQAFKKREKEAAKTPSKSSSSTTEESKRVNEWVLEDWAIRDGVQSTTRYRKNNYAKRGWAVEHSVKRALSGRKGGCATRASRQRRRGQVMPFAYHPQHLLEFRPVSPTYSSQAEVYGMGAVPPPPGHYDVMPYYTSLETYQEGMMVGGCGGDSTSEPLHLRLSDANFQQRMANSSNLHHTNHTVPCDEPIGQNHRTPTMDMGYGHSELQRYPGARCQDAEACPSPPASCRPYHTLPESPYVWWNQSSM